MPSVKRFAPKRPEIRVPRPVRAEPTPPPGAPPGGLHIAGLATADPAHLGGKGRGLQHLASLGLPVLPTRVVLAPSLTAFLAANALDTPTPEAVRAAPFPEGWREHLIAEARRLGPSLAVRSSGLDEDGREQSFAGVHHTALGVRPEDVPDAVRRVWASAWSEAATAYGRRAPRGMAVVLQPQLQPEAAGVVFTINPQNGSWRELVIEAVRGQGEALVSGRAQPQYWIVRRPRKLPGQRLWNRLTLRIVQRDPVEQPTRWGLRDGTLLAEPTHERGALLSDARLLQLCRLALRAEHHLGEPLDLEFALHDGRLVLLQARPITTTHAPRRRDVLWTRRFFGERWPVPPTPLSWSLLAPLIEWFIAYPDVQDRFLGGGPAIRLIEGRPYLNATVFRHLLFKWPGSPAPQFMLELIPPDEADLFRRKWRVKADWAVYNAIFATTWREKRWRRFAFNPFTNHEVWDAYAVRFEAEQEALSTPVLGTHDAVQRVRAQTELVRDYLSIHVCSLLFANLWYQVLGGCLSSWVDGDTATWMEQLAVCPPGNQTLATNQALYALGQRLGEPGRSALAEGRPLEAPARQALARFLSDYGHRAEASWEIFSPRWADDPARLAPLLDFVVEPRERVGRQEERFLAARDAALARVEGWRHRVLDGVLHYTRRYLLLRENQRFAFDRLLAGMQRTLLALGEGLGLEDPADIRWLTWDEVVGLAHGTFEDPLPIEARRRAWEEACTREPAVFYRGDVPADVRLSGRRLQGLGVSPGRVRGRVRVLHSAQHGRDLQPGEILVARALDPGWTPLLLKAGAVVLELGSVLSHGAVVAREYDVPAVVNLSGITRSLRDGTEVTVDGYRGLVWVHSP